MKVSYASFLARLTGVIKIKMPRADEATKAFFESILPDDPRVKVRPVFGSVAAFVSGKMFSGVFGNDVSVRLPEGERAQLLKEENASLLLCPEGRLRSTSSCRKPGVESIKRPSMGDALLSLSKPDAGKEV